jgi:hypothetical protein
MPMRGTPPSGEPLCVEERKGRAGALDAGAKEGDSGEEGMQKRAVGGRVGERGSGGREGRCDPTAVVGEGDARVLAKVLPSSTLLGAPPPGPSRAEREIFGRAPPLPFKFLGIPIGVHPPLNLQFNCVPPPPPPSLPHARPGSGEESPSSVTRHRRHHCPRGKQGLRMSTAESFLLLIEGWKPCFAIGRRRLDSAPTFR